MAKAYKCPHCGANNKVLSFTQRLGENIPTTFMGAVATLVVSTISLGFGALFGIAVAAYQWADGYTVTCHKCQKHFKVEG